MQILVLALVAILAVASRSDPSSAQPMSAASGSSLSQRHHGDNELKITGAFVDFGAKTITIFGQDFYRRDKHGRYPRVVRFSVSLGEEDITARCLPPTGPEPTPTQIVCDFSGQDDRLPDDGDYRLTVATGRGDKDRDQYDLTIGAVGPQGEPGETGPAGPQGSPGPQGPAGVAGPQGATGPQGPQGVAGVPGPQGETGAAGEQGAKGLQWRGAWSAATEYAADDAVHFEGSAYIALLPGTNKNPAAEAAFWSLLAQKGDTGAKGDQGDPGKPGEPGKQGPQGAAGAPGANGADGAQGPQGPAGPQGPRGFTGPAGPAGVAGLRTSRFPVTVNPNTSKIMKAGCFSDEVAISGGFYFLDHDEDGFDFGRFVNRIRPVSSGPGSTDRRWVTIVVNESDATAAGFFFIICARTS